METRRQPNGVVTATKQPMFVHAMLCGAAWKGLTTAVSCASVVGMKTRPNTGIIAAGLEQPCSYAVVSQAGCARPLTRATPQGRRCYTGQHDGNTKPNRSNPQQHTTVHSWQRKCDENSKYETQSEKSATLSEMPTMRTSLNSISPQAEQTNVAVLARQVSQSRQSVCDLTLCFLGASEEISFASEFVCGANADEDAGARNFLCVWRRMSTRE